MSFDDIGMIFPDGTEALQNISFDLSRGEFVTIVGPSGCGKSTLLKIASGLLEPTAGNVDVDRERLGYVFQDATLLPWRTVSKNVELLAELHGTSIQDRKKLVQESIELVGLEGFEDHYSKSLSGGMKMRCSLARSLTLKPPVFLFDGSTEIIAISFFSKSKINLLTNSSTRDDFPAPPVPVIPNTGVFDLIANS